MFSNEDRGVSFVTDGIVDSVFSPLLSLILMIASIRKTKQPNNNDYYTVEPFDLWENGPLHAKNANVLCVSDIPSEVFIDT